MTRRLAPEEIREWTGPLRSDWDSQARVRLKAPVPPERWPYGPPDHHETHCNLHRNKASRNGLFCDCLASVADDDDYGAAP